MPKVSGRLNAWHRGALFCFFSVIVLGLYKSSELICYLGYPECNPFIGVQARTEWSLPSDPAERAAYSEAQGIVLPETIPKVTPFDFRAARIDSIGSFLARGGQAKTVSEMYLEHLCETEAGTYIIDTREDVSGLRLLRTPYVHQGSADQPHERELAAIRHGLGETDLSDWPYREVPLAFDLVQPSVGSYLYYEQPEPLEAGLVARFERTSSVSRHATAPNLHRYKANAMLKQHGGRIPLFFTLHRSQAPIAKAAITWRGIRRDRDEEFGIAGAEIIALDLGTNQVIAVHREFLLNLPVDGDRYMGTREIRCPQRLSGHDWLSGTVLMTERVFVPIAGVKDVVLTPTGELAAPDAPGMR